MRCIPNSVAPSPHSPTPGKICRSQCCDSTSPWERDYISECKSHGGAVLFKDIDLLWNNASYACKGLFGKPTPCGEKKRKGEGRAREERALITSIAVCLCVCVCVCVCAEVFGADYIHYTL